MNANFTNEVKAGKHTKENMTVSYEAGHCDICNGEATVRVTVFHGEHPGKIVTWQCNDSECDHREFTSITL